MVLTLGAIAVLWTTTLHLRISRLNWKRRLVESGVGIAQACALLYCAIVFSGLWLKFVQTIMMGAED
jgi:hypothetical protein